MNDNTFLVQVADYHGDDDDDGMLTYGLTYEEAAIGAVKKVVELTFEGYYPGFRGEDPQRVRVRRESETAWRDFEVYVTHLEPVYLSREVQP